MGRLGGFSLILILGSSVALADVGGIPTFEDFFAPMTDTEYQLGEERLEEALRLTRFPRPLSEIAQAYYRNGQVALVESPYNTLKRTFSLYLPLQYPAEAWVRLLSRDPGAEPAYQKYLRDQRDRLPALLQTHESPVHAQIYSALFSQFCESEPSGPTEELKFDSLTAEARIHSSTGYRTFTISKVTDGKALPLSELWLDHDCLWVALSRYEYRPDLRPEAFSVVTADERVIGPIQQNAEALPLERIYSSDRLAGIKRGPLSRPRTLVTVIDTGVDYNHPALAYAIPRESQPFGYDFDESDFEPFDFFSALTTDAVCSHSHGTHVTGIVLQGAEDDLAILPLRYPGASAAMSPPSHYSGFYQAIQFARERGSRVVNLSLAYDWRETPTLPALERAIRDFPDMLFVCAAGNEGRNLDVTPAFPASLPAMNILSVASVDREGGLSKFSNYGRLSVDVAAPGEKIVSAVPGGGQAKMTGTSMATPAVTRLAALILHARPCLAPDEVIDVIVSTVDRREGLEGKLSSGGIVNERRALRAALERQCH